MKVIKQVELENRISELKAAGKRIVFTNGCFDILHAGHVRYLQAAKQQGDVLIVGLNSDASVRVLKGPERPINGEQDRAEVLSALSAVDYVVVFDEVTAVQLISLIRPQVYVKGGDYEVKHLPEAEIVNEYGGETVLIPEVPGRSTTGIVRRLKGETRDA